MKMKGNLTVILFWKGNNLNRFANSVKCQRSGYKTKFSLSLENLVEKSVGSQVLK